MKTNINRNLYYKKKYRQAPKSSALKNTTLKKYLVRVWYLLAEGMW